MRVLLESAAAPWCAPLYLAARMGASVESVAAACNWLAGRGLMQHATQRLSYFPSELFAPTARGLTQLARQYTVPAERLAAWARLSPDRFWRLRCSLDLAQEVYAFGLALKLAEPGLDVQYDAMLVRSFCQHSMVLHGRVAIRVRATPAQWRVFYLLMDHGQQSPTQHARMLRYFAMWSKRRAAGAPGLLIVTTTAFRATALLGMLRDMNCRFTAFATWDRLKVFRAGAQRAQWARLATCNDSEHAELSKANPFGDDAPSVSTTAHLPAIVESLGKSRAHEPKPFAFETQPAWAAGVEHVESLDDARMRLLRFVCGHPACPFSTLAAFVGLSLDVLEAMLKSLEELQLVQRFALVGLPPNGQIGFAATPMAVRLCALRDGRETGYILRTHEAFVRERQRRPDHGLAVFDFFELLKLEAERRSRAARKSVSTTDESSARVVPQFELTTFEDEMSARVAFVHRNVKHFWWPDAFGRLRCGHTWTDFWLEIDGTDRTPARTQPSKWQAKLDGLCALYASRAWVRRYPVFPIWLVLTTDFANVRVIRDLAESSARAYSVPVPAAFVASAEAVKQRGVLAPVWVDARERQGPGRDFTHAVRGAQS